MGNTIKRALSSHNTNLKRFLLINADKVSFDSKRAFDG